MMESAPAHPPGLRALQFHRIAEAGFNDPCNAYPHSMCWFRDHLYVGTTRCVLHLLYNRFEALKSWPVFPIKPAKNVYKDLDIRAQIWRYSPRTGEWKMVYVSPMMKTPEGVDIPHFQGVRNMMVYRSASDDAPQLYAMTWSPQKGPGPMLLRSTDGEHFEPIPMAGALASQFSTFRPMVVMEDGRLITAPTGRTGSANSAGVALVMETNDPRGQTWTQVNENNFGDDHNETIFEMAAFNGHVYAGTLNPEGFQLWKTDALGKPPYTWKRVLKRGGDRGPVNEGVGSLCVFNNALYVGSVINNGGYDRKYGIGPAPVEIIRVHPDDSWDLVMGDGRLTDDGMKMPLSGLGGGFDKFFNSYLWRMCVHDGWLYAGTFAWSALLHYIPRDKWPDAAKSLFDKDRTKMIVDRVGGFDLWRTRNGATWLPVTQNGFGNTYNWGVRTMASSPYGLFVGIANPFGPEVAVPRNEGWQYEANPRGGCEIWLGSTTPPPPSNIVPKAVDLSTPPLRLTAPEDREAFIDATIDAFYGHSGHRAIGCWTERTRTAAEACDNLVDEALALLPQKTGRIVDFGCGAGATTRRLLKWFPAKEISGLCLDKKIPPHLSEDASGITWTKRAQPASADIVVTLETLSRESNGQALLRDAVKALKPGGWIVGAQALSAHPGTPWRTQPGWRKKPVTTADGFAGLLTALGLADVKVLDRTAVCWTLFHAKFGVYLWEKRLENELDEELQEAVREALHGAFEPFQAYILFAARKP
ncbi:MAG TPA: hypothetical protein PKE12_14060 [Kiritimatiellia bacterium]|nr:hypothetical protein [Kiritimatiellia bacterium]